CRIQLQSSRKLTTTATINNTFIKTNHIKPNLSIVSVKTPSYLPTTPISIPVRLFHPKKQTNKKKIRVGYRFRPHHASAKRYRPLANGVILRFKSGMNHKRRRKTKRQLRSLSKKVSIPKTHYRRVRLMLGLKRLPKP